MSNPKTLTNIIVFAASFTFATFTASANGQVIDDHFTGIGGGIPPGWIPWVGNEAASVIDDSGATTVSLVGNFQAVIHHSTTFNPSGGFSMTAEITSISSAYVHVGAVVDPSIEVIVQGLETLPDLFLIQLTSGGALRASSLRPGESTFAGLSLGTIAYAGGPVDISLSVDAAGFRVMTDVDNFDSGDITWDEAFGASNGYTLSDLGTNASAFIQSDNGTAVYDRFTTSINMVLLGDVNLDGVVNLLDVAPFIALITENEFQAEADINQDGAVDLLDVAPFVALLTGG